MFAFKLPIEAKLDIDFSSSSEILGEHIEEYTKDNKSFNVEVLRKKLNRKETASVLHAIPKSIRNKCIGVCKTYISKASPHVHTQDKCVINFYISVSGEKTVFYKEDIKKLKRETNSVNNGYFFVDTETLIPAQSFIAESGDVWVLDTTIPHAVYSINSE